MNPIIPHVWTPEERARYGVRGIEDFTTEELARLQEKLAGWMRLRAPHPGGARQRTPFVMRRRTDAPAEGVTPPGINLSGGRETS